MNVFITGAGGGLGKALATECAKRGYNLYLTDINGSALQNFARGLMAQYRACVHTFICDVRSQSQINAVAEEIRKSGARIDMLLNVVGIDYEGGFTSQDIENIMSIVQINIEATLKITYEILKLRSGEGFKILFVSSLASMFPIPLKATYAATKRFLLDFATALRQELKGEKVSVLTLCPGGLASNETALNCIVAQGFWGSATTNRLEVVAKKSISKLLKGKRLYIPGALNKMLYLVSRFIPRTALANILYGRWHNARRKRLQAEF